MPQVHHQRGAALRTSGWPDVHSSERSHHQRGAAPRTSGWPDVHSSERSQLRTSGPCGSAPDDPFGGGVATLAAGGAAGSPLWGYALLRPLVRRARRRRVLALSPTRARGDGRQQQRGDAARAIAPSARVACADAGDGAGALHSVDPTAPQRHETPVRRSHRAVPCPAESFPGKGNLALGHLPRGATGAHVLCGSAGRPQSRERRALLFKVLQPCRRRARSSKSRHDTSLGLPVRIRVSV